MKKLNYKMNQGSSLTKSALIRPAELGRTAKSGPENDLYVLLYIHSVGFAIFLINSKTKHQKNTFLTTRGLICEK